MIVWQTTLISIAEMRNQVAFINVFAQWQCKRSARIVFEAERSAEPGEKLIDTYQRYIVFFIIVGRKVSTVVDGFHIKLPSHFDFTSGEGVAQPSGKFALILF